MVSLFKNKLLIVDDSESFLDVISPILKKAGYSIIAANSYYDAVRALKKNKNIKAVWLDHYLTGTETGVDLLKYIRGHDELKELPVLLVSKAGSDTLVIYEKMGLTKTYSKTKHTTEEIVHNVIEDLKKVAQ